MNTVILINYHIVIKILNMTVAQKLRPILIRKHNLKLEIKNQQNPKILALEYLQKSFLNTIPKIFLILSRKF